jgi:hypothetical protein
LPKASHYSDDEIRPSIPPATEKERVTDFLVDFTPGHIPGYFDMFGGPGLIGMEEELAEMVGKEQAFLHSSTGIPSGRKKALAGALARAEPFYQAPKTA